MRVDVKHSSPPGEGECTWNPHSEHRYYYYYFFSKKIQTIRVARAACVRFYCALFLCGLPVSLFSGIKTDVGYAQRTLREKKQGRKGWERGGRKQAARSSVRAPFFFFFFYARDASRANVVFFTAIRLHITSQNWVLLRFFFSLYYSRTLSIVLHISSFKSQMNLSVCNIDIKHHHRHRRYRPFAPVTIILPSLPSSLIQYSCTIHLSHSRTDKFSFAQRRRPRRRAATNRRARGRGSGGEGEVTSAVKRCKKSKRIYRDSRDWANDITSRCI